MDKRKRRYSFITMNLKFGDKTSAVRLLTFNYTKASISWIISIKTPIVINDKWMQFNLIDKFRNLRKINQWYSKTSGDQKLQRLL